MNPYIFILILSQLLIVSWIDIKTRTIANHWHLLNMACGLLAYFYLDQLYLFDWSLFILPIGFIFVGFVLFLAGVMGAGDSKYIAGLALVIPLRLHFLFFESLLYSTLLVGGILLTMKVIKDFKKIRAYIFSRYWLALRDIIRSEFSYAPVILIAWIFTGLRIWIR